jgi:hypothetical protein
MDIAYDRWWARLDEARYESASATNIVYLLVQLPLPILLVAIIVFLSQERRANILPSIAPPDQVFGTAHGSFRQGRDTEPMIPIDGQECSMFSG